MQEEKGDKIYNIHIYVDIIAQRRKDSNGKAGKVQKIGNLDKEKQKKGRKGPRWRAIGGNAYLLMTFRSRRVRRKATAILMASGIRKGITHQESTLIQPTGPVLLKYT